jgi:alpha-L-fucosidase 2
MGAAWLVQHVWEHYEFNGDPIFLRERAWPLLKQAALFFIDFLVEDPQTGQYVSGPSMSPENSYYSMHGERVSMTMGPSMDQQIIYELLTNCIEACETMDSEHEFKDSLTSIRSKLATPRIGSDGRIMEWRKEYQEAEPGHRHISHLFALHPGTQLTHDQTPEFMKAAEKTLAYRLRHGGGHTGWSRAWIINFYARLLNSEAAYNNFQSLLASSTLPNLLDHHPPFQIDGNFGGCAGIAEMLLQSHESFIRVLPALPDQWSEGHIRGLRARGGFEIDIHWEEGELKSLKIRSILGRICRIVYKNVVQEFPTEQGMEYLLNPRLELQ